MDFYEAFWQIEFYKNTYIFLADVTFTSKYKIPEMRRRESKGLITYVGLNRWEKQKWHRQMWA